MGCTIVSAPVGTSPDGRVVTRYRLEAPRVAAEILTLGGILHRLEAPDRDGRIANVVLGLPDLDAYLTRNRYFGTITGRFANRIAGGRFSLDGREYRLPVNNGSNHLHGGPGGFDTRLWEAAPAADADRVALTLRHVSPDGEEGYPGTLETTVTYGLTDACLRIEYRATTDAPTIVNLTNHAYFNLAGDAAPDVLDHELTLRASRFLPTDQDQIPTGELAAVDGKPFDFREPHLLGARIREPHPQLLVGHGYDHSYILDQPGLEQPAAILRHPMSGRTLAVATDAPLIQLYSGNMLDGTVVGAAGLAYRQSAGVCLETQRYPDAPNQPTFPSAELRPGKTFESVTTLRLGVG